MGVVGKFGATQLLSMFHLGDNFLTELRPVRDGQLRHLR